MTTSDDRIRERRQYLLRQYARAGDAHDDDTTAEARQAILGISMSSNPRTPILPMQSCRQPAYARERRKREAEHGCVATTWGRNLEEPPSIWRRKV